jgi:hypothetical protein
MISHDGTRINELLATAGHNLRLILRKLRLLFARMRSNLFSAVAKSDNWPKLSGTQYSIV